MIELLSPLFARILGDRLQDLRKRKQRTPWRSVAQVSERLNQVIKLASGPAHSESEVLSHLVEVNPGLTLTQLEEARSGTTEPSLEIVTNICESLGASYSFVWHGKGTPFQPRDEDHIPIREYLGLFREDGVDTIWFVRGNEYPHLSFIVLRYNDFKFRVLPSLFHVSAENGSGGAKALSELAHLSIAYHKAGIYETAAWGLEVKPQIAESVLYGQRHASELFRRGSKRSYWWEDLADIKHARPCAKEYCNRYDEEFFNAQKLIGWVRGEKP